MVKADKVVISKVEKQTRKSFGPKVNANAESLMDLLLCGVPRRVDGLFVLITVTYILESVRNTLLSTFPIIGKIIFTFAMSCSVASNEDCRSTGLKYLKV